MSVSRLDLEPLSPVSVATIGAGTVMSHAIRALVGCRCLSGARRQVDHLIERHHAFLTLALQPATKTPIFGWCHNERDWQPGRSRNTRGGHVRSPQSGLFSSTAPGNAAKRHGAFGRPRRRTTTMNRGRERVKRGLPDMVQATGQSTSYCRKPVAKDPSHLRNKPRSGYGKTPARARGYARPAAAAWGDGAPQAAAWGSGRSPV